MPLSPENVIKRFREGGGRFLVGPAELIAKARRLQGIALDWDGVFNSGTKDPERGSPFGEADSMGLNLLRFAMRQNLPRIPATAIITGESNPTALDFARREHLHCAYRGIGHKQTALNDFCTRLNLPPGEVAVVFDDANDLSMAQEAGLRLLVKRRAGFLFEDYAVRHGLCDYVTICEGGQGAVREICELLMGLLGRFDFAIAERTERSALYRSYFAERQAVVPEFLGEVDGHIVPAPRQ